MRKGILRKGWCAGLILTLSCIAGAQADGLKDFKRLFASQNSWEKANAIKTLDPNDKKHYKILTKLLAASDWYLREAVIEVLSGAFEAEASERMLKDLKKGKPTVAEGIALALGKASDPSKVSALTEALKHKDWRVRRSAAIALRKLPSKEAVGPLIEAWKEELKKGKHFRVWVRCLEALEEISGKKDLESIGDWENWWAGAKDSFVVGGKKEEKKGGTSTVVRGVNLNYDSRGKGNPLLVIPDYGFEKDYLKTYLRNLEKSNKIIYMDLPGAADFNPALPPKVAGLPVYPLEKLSDAFDTLLKNMVKEKKIKKGKINLFAHGMSCWIAMKYASKYPKSIGRMMLCAPFSSGKAWSDGNDRHVKHGQASRDVEEEHFALSRILVGGQAKYQAKSAAEGDALRRKSFTIYFADPRDSEIGFILGPKVVKKTAAGQSQDFKVFRPMGGVLIPSDFKLFALPKVGVTTLVVCGKHAVMTSVQDCQAIVKHYPRGKLLVFPKTARMPFIEENSRFVKAAEKFFN